MCVQLTIGKLKEMVETGATGSARDELQITQQAPSVQEEKVDMVELERQMTSLFKLRIDVNDILTSEKITKINQLTTGAPPVLQTTIHPYRYAVVLRALDRGHIDAVEKTGCHIAVSGVLLPVHAHRATRFNRGNGSVLHWRECTRVVCNECPCS
jgi:hypothetical protein